MGRHLRASTGAPASGGPSHFKASRTEAIPQAVTAIPDMLSHISRDLEDRQIRAGLVCGRRLVQLHFVSTARSIGLLRRFGAVTRRVRVIVNVAS